MVICKLDLALSLTTCSPLILTLSPHAGRGDGTVECTAHYLLPACGEKVAGRPDDGHRRNAGGRTRAPRRSPPMWGRCPAGQRGVAPNGGLSHA